MKKAAFLSIVLVIIATAQSVAQCAMCRSTLENNYAAGKPGIAAGINTGILYLLSMPYLAVLVLWYFWYKTSRNARKELSHGPVAR